MKSPRIDTAEPIRAERGECPLTGEMPVYALLFPRRENPVTLRLKIFHNRYRASGFAIREFPLFLFCRFGPLRQCAQEWIRVLRRLNLDRERCLERHHASIENASVFLVLLHDGPGQFQSGKSSPGTRVSQDLRFQFPVGIGGGMTTDRTRSSGIR